jgi:hypothetical protein
MEKTDNLRRLYKEHLVAKEAASAAAGDLFANEPLPNVGSDAWRTLWDAARAYSAQQAYPGESFPVTRQGARCVLCQQELGQEAAGRLVRFDDFIKNESRKREQAAREAYEASCREIKGASLSIKDIRATAALVRNELNDDPLAAQVRRSTLTAKWTLRHILRSHARENAPPAPSADTLPSHALARHSAEIGNRVAALTSEIQSEERKKLIAECDELSDRQWLAVVQEDVIAEIERRKEIAALQTALKDTATNRITAKSDEIAENLVTNALRAQFSKEVGSLGVAGLAIELRKEKSSYGMPLFRVTLIKKPEVKVGDILSEGEHRCVAIAAFLAELSTSDSHSTVVFDDPVSSLDHLHREDLAKRLAAEGKKRQVIIFTHDIAFLFLLNEACHEQETHIAFRCVQEGRNRPAFAIRMRR